MVRVNWAVSDNCKDEMDIHSPMSDRGNPKAAGQQREATHAGGFAANQPPDGPGSGSTVPGASSAPTTATTTTTTTAAATTTTAAAIAPASASPVDTLAAASMLYFRVERQTLTKLPKSGFVR
jgi:hypothetical protein